MTPAERWLTAMWPVVRAPLPVPPARVVELGCGPHGGFVPMLRADGYDAVGVDPEAPDGDAYRRTEFERAGPLEALDAVVASTSLHHVNDPAVVIAGIESALARDGVVVVVEWGWEDFDEATALWCFDRLGPDEESGWLRRRRDEWLASGRSWDAYLRRWAESERLHAGELLLRLLDGAFERESLARGPYFFPDLAATAEADERAAIAAGQIRATRLDYVARRRA